MEEEQIEFEVEDILRYRRDNGTGEEFFLVKWQGFSAEEATWEPLAHMNDNCKELVSKARALYAYRQPAGGEIAVAATEPADSLAAADPYAVPVDDVAGESPLAVAPSDGVLDGVQHTPIMQEVHSPPPTDTGSRPWPGVTTVSQVPHSVNASTPKVPPPVPDALKRAAAAPAGMPAKRPKLQAPSLGPPSPAGRGGDAPITPSPREVQLPKWQEGPIVVCRKCSGEQPRGDVENNIGGRVPYEYYCPPCRLEHVDEFHPSVQQGLLRYSYATASSTLSLSFNAHAAQWRKQQWAVHLRAVAMNSGAFTGPAWPNRVQGKLNGKQCVAIDPPKHLHVRREQCYNLTPLLRQGLNTLELKFSPPPDRPRDQIDEGYCIGVVLTRPRSVASIIARIRTRSTETVSSGRERVERIIARAQRASDMDDCKVTGNFGRMLKPLCPVSLCPIEESAIGRLCNHVQVFDLQAYIAVNQKMRSLDKRWTCPVCSKPLRPDDVLLDPFAQGILDTLRGDEEAIEAVVFNENCTWSTISAVKADEDKATGSPMEDGTLGTQASAEIVDLSDSE